MSPAFAALPLDPRTAWLIAGLLYVLMPLVVWSVLYGRHDWRSAGLWCFGAALSGLALIAIGLRDLAAPALLLVVGNFANYLGIGLRWSALRREQGRPSRGLTLLLLAIAATAGLVFTHRLGEQPRLVYNHFVTAALAFAITLEALNLARLRDSRSARLVAGSYGLLAGVLLLRSLALALGWVEAKVLYFGLDAALVVLVGMLSALWGNIGYLGFAMEMAQRRASTGSAQLAAANARSDQAERQAAALKSVSDERQELLRVLSHEVRQPLHNAQAVLQGVDRALRGELTDGEAVAGRIDRARSVLGQITGGLDNILAASTLLVGDRPTPLRDTEIEMLLDLSIGDLPPATRGRVRIVHDTNVRTAAMDVGLMRLALRNLLTNALAYTPAGSEVTVRVADTDEPLAVTFEVGDGGPGIAPELLPHLFERGTRGRHDLPGQGLGLYIVQLALRRQGGTVAVYSTAHGTVFTLTVPQGQEPA